MPAKNSANRLSNERAAQEETFKGSSFSNVLNFHLKSSKAEPEKATAQTIDVFSKETPSTGNGQFRPREISPLCQKIQSLRKINRGQNKNLNKKLNQKVFGQGALNLNFKKRLLNHSELLDEIGSYYNPTYVKQFNKDSPVEPVTVPAKLVDNPLSMKHIQEMINSRNKLRSEGALSHQRSDFIVHKDGIREVKTQSQPFDCNLPIREFDEINYFRRCLSPILHRFINKKLPLVLRNNRGMSQKPSRQAKRKQFRKFIPSDNSCSKNCFRNDLSNSKRKNNFSTYIRDYTFGEVTIQNEGYLVKNEDKLKAYKALSPKLKLNFASLSNTVKNY